MLLSAIFRGLRRQTNASFSALVRYVSLTYDVARTTMSNMGKTTATQLPLPTDAELEILLILWDSGPQTVREVHAALKNKQTGYTTVLKQMQVMTGKGLVERSERFRSHLYTAKQPRESTQQGLINDLLQRAFSGSAKNLVLGALSARPVSAPEIAEIKRAIRDYEKEHR